MTATVTYARAGQLLESDDARYVETVPATAGVGTAIAVGKIGTFVNGELVINPIDGSGIKPFVMIIEPKLDADTKAVVLTKGKGIGIAGVAIPVGSRLTGCDDTDREGDVQPAVEAGTPTPENKIIGLYGGHPGEGSGNSPYTDAADGDLIVIDIL